VLADNDATRCPQCRQSLRRKRPRVLGEETRIGASFLPIDRWMLDRLHSDGHGRGRASLPPLAWHGRFTTSPLAAPAFASTPPPVGAPLPPPSAPPQGTEPTPITPPVDEQPPATVGALALDVYTRPVSYTEPAIAEDDDARDDRDGDGEIARPPVAMWTPPSTPLATAIRPVVPHEELDPDVRALVDDLYEQARVELSGNDVAFFAPVDHEHDEPMVFEAQPLLPSLETRPAAPATPPASPEPPRARGGWIPAITTDERRGRR
jgi:hypothetical protein